MAAPDLRPPEPSEEESVGALVARLGTDVTRIVRAEIALVQVRLEGMLAAVRAAGGGLAAGALCLIAGFVITALAVVLVLARALPAWLAALAVGLGLLGTGALLTVLAGRALGKGLRTALGTDAAPLTEKDHTHGD
jgi:hypothetical protein